MAAFTWMPQYPMCLTNIWRQDTISRIPAVLKAEIIGYSHPLVVSLHAAMVPWIVRRGSLLCAVSHNMPEA